MADILTEFTGKQAKLSENGLAILIHDKPVKQTLPKLTLTGCNIREFIEAHKLENVIKAHNKTKLNSLKNFIKRFIYFIF